MQNLSYWKKFESTGKIEDYLSYCGCLPKERRRPQDSENTADVRRDRRISEQLGANPYEGIH